MRSPEGRQCDLFHNRVIIANVVRATAQRMHIHSNASIVNYAGRDMKVFSRMRNFVALAFLLALAFPSVLAAQKNIPPGTILPLELRTTLNSEKGRPGQKINARIMQDVPLPGGRKIPGGSKVTGYIEGTTRAGAGRHGAITIKFVRIERKREPLTLTANLRALASVMEVESAQIPTTGMGLGTPYSWATRELIGGQVAYGDGGPVANGFQVVGRVADGGGVIAPIPSRSIGVPESPHFLRLGLWGSNKVFESCSGDVAGNQQAQAFWLFSTDACGLFGYNNLYIVHAGTTEPLGQITIAAKHGQVKIESGSGLLLRVMANPSPASMPENQPR